MNDDDATADYFAPRSEQATLFDNRVGHLPEPAAAPLYTPNAPTADPANPTTAEKRATTTD